jgi:HK97 family phage portal protein
VGVGLLDRLRIPNLPAERAAAVTIAATATSASSRIPGDIMIGGTLSTNPDNPVTMKDVTDQLEAYRDRPWVHACISRISSAMKQAPLKLYRGGPAGEGDELDEHPLLDLWRLPNPQTTGRAFRASMMVDLETTGNFFAEVVYGQTGDSFPLQMWRITPSRIRIIVAPNGEVAGYIFDPGGGAKKIPLRPDQVWHRRYSNPLDDYRGMGPLLAARDSVVWEQLAMRENIRLFENGLKTTGVLSGPPDLDPDTLSLARQMVRAKTQRGWHEPLVLPGDWSWADLTKSPQDADWLAGKQQSREEVCAVFGVPPPVAGDMTRSTYSNYEEANSTFWTSTITEKYHDLDEDITVRIVPLFGAEDLHAEHDLSETPAGAEDDDAKVTRTVAGWNAGLYTLNEAREEIGEEQIDGDAGDLRRVPISVQEVPVDETPADRAEASGLSSPAEPAASNPPLPGDGGGEPAAPPPAGTRGDGAAGKTSTRSARELTIHQVVRQTRTQRIVEHSTLELRKTMRRQRDALVRWVESSGTKAANPKDPSPQDVPGLIQSFGWTAAGDRFLKAVRATHLLAVEQAWHAASESVGVEIAYNLHDPRVVHRLASLADRPDGVRSVTGGVRADVLAEVKDGLARGAGIDQIVNGGSWVDLAGEKQTMRGITGVYDEWTGPQAYRAERIARTETGVAYNVSTTDAYDEAGVRQVLVHDGTDDECADADGQTWSLAEAADNPLAHPNCTRAFAPVVES